MKTLYVRIAQNKEAESFFRCGIEFGQDWKPVTDLDDATAQRLQEEQMLEVTETRPAELDDDAQAGDSSVVIALAVDAAGPPADATAVTAEVIAPEAAAEVIAPEAAAEVIAPEAAAEVIAPEAAAEVIAPEAAAEVIAPVAAAEVVKSKAKKAK